MSVPPPDQLETMGLHVAASLAALSPDEQFAVLVWLVHRYVGAQPKPNLVYGAFLSALDARRAKV